MEWSDGTIPVEKYNPTDLDCDQWIRVARDAGFRYVVLVTKHHDGFCLWDSPYTDYDVASSPVKTDVVAEVAKACKKYGLKFGLYYSLWDRHEPSYQDENPQKYIDYMLSQLTELFTQYGPVCELWFDGGWMREPKDWGIDQLYTQVKKLQPNCAVGVNQTIVNKDGERDYTVPSLMTENNKFYFQYFPGDFRLWDPQLANLQDKKQYLHNGESYYLPFEHTICLSKTWTWFQKSTPRPVRDLDEMQELFYWCTRNDNVLVVNVPPDNTGRIRENEANAVIALGNRLKIEKGKPLPTNGRIISVEKSASANSVYSGDDTHYGAKFAVDGAMQTRWAAEGLNPQLVVNLNESDRFNKIVIFEFQDSKQSSDPGDIFSNQRMNRIQSYTIDRWENNSWQTIYVDDEPMYDCKVIHFPTYYSSSKIRLNVLKATAPPSIYEFQVMDNQTVDFRY
ncbi:MAG: alpha-L-fucosidase [Prolixibacteraceae bacterium]|jgi:alpha-L-fucosidase